MYILICFIKDTVVHVHCKSIKLAMKQAIPVSIRIISVLKVLICFVPSFPRWLQKVTAGHCKTIELETRLQKIEKASLTGLVFMLVAIQ